MASEQKNMVLIPLTDRRPVAVSNDEWPVIAAAGDCRWDNRYKSQANRIWNYDLRVRQHADGRAIVYGQYDYSSTVENDRGVQITGGELVKTGGDIVAAVMRVGRSLMDEVPSGDRHHDGSEIFQALVRECIAKLPPEEIS